MIRKFLRDKRGDYMIATAIAILPIMGGLALAVDYAEMTRQRSLTLNALDAAAIATARRLVSGATEAEAINYAKDFFAVNMQGMDVSGTRFEFDFPSSETGGGLLTVSAERTYQPYFLSTFGLLLGKEMGVTTFSAETKVRLKNTLEVALVLDNSGSMDYTGSGSGKKRLALLKEAAKQLVTTLAGEGAKIKQVDKPVQFGLVPFAASVNVGSQYANAAWMDTQGRSPTHHENFNWSTMPSNRQVTLTDGVYRKTGEGWGSAQNDIVTRFTLLDAMKRITDYETVQTGTTTQRKCSGSWGNRTCWDEVVPVYEDVPVYSSYASWQGCVETRPYPYNTDDTTPNTTTPATLFVPMFGPDETDQYSGGYAENNYWPDGISDTASKRQAYMWKYFTPVSGGSAASDGHGPNASCTTKAITPLTDVTKEAGLTSIKNAIDAMAANGATNVPQGLSWGWRVVSSGAPFTDGRSESEKGNDKVVIVLTDGANTYYTPGSLGYGDAAGNKSTYSAYGYTAKKQPGESYTRLFMGTDSKVNKSTYDNSNYTKAMDQQLAKLCDNAKAGGLMVMTVALDLSLTKNDEKGQIEGLKACASDSRFRKDPDDELKPAKLFWNTTGGELEKTFKAIADELSNLRIVS